MSLIISPAVAQNQSAASATKLAARSGDQQQNDGSSFGQVLNRSLASTEKTTAKSAEKATERSPVRRQTANEEKDPQDPAAALTLALSPLDAALANLPAGGPDNAASMATDVRLDEAITATTGKTTAGKSDPLHATRALPAADGDGNANAASGADIDLTARNTAPGMPTAFDPKKRGQTELPTSAIAAGDTAVKQNDGGDVGKNDATAEADTSIGVQRTPQVMLTSADQGNNPQAAQQAKDIAGAPIASLVSDADKIAVQATTPNTGFAGQQSKRGNTAADTQVQQSSAKPEVPSAQAFVAANGIETPAGSKAVAPPVDQFNLSAAALLTPANAPVQPAAGSAAAPVGLPLTPPVGSHEWADALGKQIVWMGNANHQVAEMHLNPPNLGPLKVTLTITDNQAQAMFVSAHQSVRAAVEAAMPQLRTSLADNGISLGNTSVSADTQQQQNAFAQNQSSQSSPSNYRSNGASIAGLAGNIALPAVTPAAIHDNGNAIDTFA